MAEITAAMVAKLRQATNAGMMGCKRALDETNGDFQAAVDLLRKRGVASAANKSAREAREGVITQFIQTGARRGLLVEINCQTDFVARNDTFRAFCNDVAQKLLDNPQADYEADRAALVAKMGENIKVSRHQAFEVQGNGMIAAYIHTGSKIGVLVEVGSGKEDTLAKEEFKQLVRDITLQIAAGSPSVVCRKCVSAEVIAKEEEIARAQVQGKPAPAIAKIVEGKIEKFYQGFCLVDQGYVKRNSEISVNEYIQSVAKLVGDEITVRRFVRFQVGEVVA